MGLVKKTKNKAQATKGKTKKTTGRATGDRWMEAEGKTDQVKGNVKQAGEKVRDAFKE